MKRTVEGREGQVRGGEGWERKGRDSTNSIECTLGKSKGVALVDVLRLFLF
jgi:hypothetical protein